MARRRSLDGQRGLGRSDPGGGVGMARQNGESSRATVRESLTGERAEGAQELRVQTVKRGAKGGFGTPGFPKQQPRAVDPKNHLLFWLAEVALIYSVASLMISTVSYFSASKASGSGTVCTKTNPDDGLSYVWVPPGDFQMGCSPQEEVCPPGSKRSHKVIIRKGFWLGQTEVTVAAWNRAMNKRSPVSIRASLGLS